MDGAEISLIDGKRELRFMSGRDKKHSRHVPHDKKYQLTTATEPVFFLYSFFYLLGVTNLRLLQAYQNRNEFKTQCSNLHSNPKHYHRHASLQGRMAKHAAYPQSSCAMQLCHRR